ncbi:hypothetical protein FRB99_004815, partial [Tulasnella sp. 403]
MAQGTNVGYSRNFRRVAKVIEPHAHRCHTPVVRVRDLEDDQFDIQPFIREAMLGSSATLNAFAVSGKPDGRTCLSSYIRGQVPSFREVDVPDVLIGRLRPIMTGLTYLDIWQGLDGQGLQVELGWLFGVLRSSPQLRYFSLTSHDEFQMETGAAMRLPQIHLPCLKTVDL